VGGAGGEGVAEHEVVGLGHGVQDTNMARGVNMFVR
jgi:hypothetical protein